MLKGTSINYGKINAKYVSISGTKIGKGGLIVIYYAVDVICFPILGDLKISASESMNIKCKNNKENVRIMGNVVHRGSSFGTEIRNVVAPSSNFKMLDGGNSISVRSSLIGSMRVQQNVYVGIYNSNFKKELTINQAYTKVEISKNIFNSRVALRNQPVIETIIANLTLCVVN